MRGKNNIKKMINLDIISKSLDEVIGKCSKAQLKNRLAKYSLSEKKELLQGKLNQGEWKEYDMYNRWINDFTEAINKYKDNPSDEPISHEYEYFDNFDELEKEMTRKINKITERLFEYDRRIFNDYSINKNNIPSIDKSLYVEDDNGDTYGISSSLGPLEEKQINLQKNMKFTDFELEGLDAWWYSNHKKINRSLYNDLMDYEKNDKRLMKNIRESKRAISQAIHKSEGLLQPTILFHGGRFDIHQNPGDHINWKGYLSLSFNKKSAEDFSRGPDKFLYVCYSPAKLKGICGNDKNMKNFHATEHEYLTDKNTGGTIVSVDYENQIVEVLMDEP